MTEEVKCYLYWIRTEGMTDIFTEGYVGISHNPQNRFEQHKSNSRTNTHHKYKKDFRAALRENKAIMEVKLVSTLSYCLDIERKLRPYMHVGWNIAIGGDGGSNIIHGLTGSKVAKTYYNLRTRAKAEGKDFEPTWLGEGGLETFKVFFDTLTEVEGEFTTKDNNLPYFKDNIIKISRSDILKVSQRNYTVDGEVFLSISELAEIYGLKPNTISSRLRNGWNTRESVGLEIRVKPKITVPNKADKPYAGKLTQEQFNFIKAQFESGMSTRNIAKLVSMSESNMSRLIRKMGYEKGLFEVETFCGEYFTLPPNSKLGLDGYLEVKDMLKEGYPRCVIADHFNVSASTLTTVCKNLHWECCDYVE